MYYPLRQDYLNSHIPFCDVFSMMASIFRVDLWVVCLGGAIPRLFYCSSYVGCVVDTRAYLRSVTLELISSNKLLPCA